MNSGTENKAKGKFDEVAGKIKQAAGEAINNQSMANRGATQQVKGQAEQAWGSVQGAAAEKQEHNKMQAEQSAHDIREKVTSTAQNMKERVEDSTDRRRNS